jgi:3-deoxy-D-manno-octulosonate 8-phosphate phosphatase (KDO 8-P phosphatase)
VTRPIDTYVYDKLSNIKLIVLDVDGVLTDGSIIYAEDETDIKAFHVQDGFGITLARQAGIQTGVLTGRIAKAVARRVKELKFDYYECGHFYKQAALQDMIKAAGVEKSQVLYMGDDVLDLVCLPYVGVFVAPANAQLRTRQEATWVTQRRGGDTAVREMINAVLDAQDILKKTEDFFMKPEMPN